MYLLNTGFSYNDLVESRGDSAVLNYHKMISGLNDDNHALGYARLDFISAVFCNGRTQLSYQHSAVVDIQLDYTKHMAQFLWYGNAAFLGQAIDLAPGLSAIRYHKTSIGVAQSAGWISFGINASYLQGASALYARGNSLQFFTDSVDYAISVESDVTVYRTRPKRLLRFTPFADNPGSNEGFAIDMGLGFRPFESLQADVALNNLGFINFNQAERWRTSGKIAFEGLDLSSYFQTDSFDVRPLRDSILNFITIHRDSSGFRAVLSPQLIFSMNYTINNHWKLTTTWQRKILKQSALNALQCGAIKVWRPGEHIIETGLSITAMTDLPIALGAGLNFTWRFLQLSCFSDNVATWFGPKARVPLYLFDKANNDAVVIPKSMKSFNLRFGLNVIFDT
ncbi:MAG: hypothetical protein Kow0075_02240 [Salibacteraceae bacterium]